MYEAMSAHDEVRRLTRLFEMERKGELPVTHKQCSHSDAELVPDNHLTCCLGVKCRECSELQSLEAMQNVEPGDIDAAKAWTCVAHIVMSGGDQAREGYVLRVDDRMYWDRVYANLAASENDVAP